MEGCMIIKVNLIIYFKHYRFLRIHWGRSIQIMHHVFIILGHAMRV